MQFTQTHLERVRTALKCGVMRIIERMMRLDYDETRDYDETNRKNDETREIMMRLKERMMRLERE